MHQYKVLQDKHCKELLRATDLAWRKKYRRLEERRCPIGEVSGNLSKTAAPLNGRDRAAVFEARAKTDKAAVFEARVKTDKAAAFESLLSTQMTISRPQTPSGELFSSSQTEISKREKSLFWHLSMQNFLRGVLWASASQCVVLLCSIQIALPKL